MLIYLQMIEYAPDRSKFEKLYYRYRQTMYAVAYKILRNPQDAEDAVHHAFVKIIENISKISEIECHKTKAYVVTIVENTAINLYRKKMRHPHVALDETEGIQVEYFGGNELARCMVELPPHYRQVLLLRHHHGYTYGEIAKMLDQTEVNVRKCEQRERQRLEKLCKEAEIL